MQNSFEIDGFPGLNNMSDAHQWLIDKISSFEKMNSKSALLQLVSSVHVWPDYHGNRSPFADPRYGGAIIGLRLVSALNRLMALYIAHIHAFAYMSRLIIEHLEAKGHHFEVILFCGGLEKNHFFVQAHADALGLPIVLPKEDSNIL